MVCRHAHNCEVFRGNAARDIRLIGVAMTRFERVATIPGPTGAWLETPQSIAWVTAEGGLDENEYRAYVNELRVAFPTDWVHRQAVGLHARDLETAEFRLHSLPFHRLSHHPVP